MITLVAGFRLTFLVGIVDATDLKRIVGISAFDA
jgi:hypothetical protein